MKVNQNAHTFPLQNTAPTSKVEIPNLISTMDFFPPKPQGDDVEIMMVSGSSSPLVIFKETADNGEGLVNKTLNRLHRASSGCFGKPHHMAAEDTRNNFREAIAHMTPGELDEVRDGIVNKMASEHVSHSDIKFLKNLYLDVDAKMENRPYNDQKLKLRLKLPTIPKTPIGTDINIAKAIVKGDMNGINDPIQAYRVVNIHLEKAQQYTEKVRELTQGIPQRLDYHPMFSDGSKTLEEVEWSTSEQLSQAREYHKAIFDEKLYAHLAAENLKKILENSSELTSMVNQELQSSWAAKGEFQNAHSVEELINRAQASIDKARAKIDAKRAQQQQTENTKPMVRTP